MTLATPKDFGRVGRLGNSLFQAVATSGIAQRQGRQWAAPADWPYRDVFEFAYPPAWLDRDDLQTLDRADHQTEARHLGEWVRPYLQDVSLFPARYPAVWFTEEAEAHASSLVPEGLDKAGSVLGVHVRRGDNVFNEPGTINLLPLDYYIKAMNRADDLATYRGLGPFDATLFVSDDPAWCRDEFGEVESDDPDNTPGDDNFYTDGTPRSKEQDPDFLTEDAVDWIDMATLASCDAVVLSNSTFAWWAAYFARTHGDGGAITVGPSYWVGPQLWQRGQNPNLILPYKRVCETSIPCEGVCEVLDHGCMVAGLWFDGNGTLGQWQHGTDGERHAPRTIEWTAEKCREVFGMDKVEA